MLDKQQNLIPFVLAPITLSLIGAQNLTFANLAPSSIQETPYSYTSKLPHSLTGTAARLGLVPTIGRKSNASIILSGLPKDFNVVQQSSRKSSSLLQLIRTNRLARFVLLALALCTLVAVSKQLLVGKPKVEAIQKPLVSFPLGALSRVVTGFTFAVQTASSFSETVAEFLEDLTDGMTAGDEIAETETTLEKLDNILPPSEQDHLAIDGTGLEPTALRANSNIAGYNPISTPTGTPGTAANPWLTGVHSAASGGGAGTGLPMGYNAFGASSPSVINLGERSANSYADFFHGPEVPVLIFTLSNVNTQRVQLEDLCRKLELALEEARQQLSAIPELPERAGYEVFAKVVDTVEGLIRQTHNKLLHIYRGYRGSAAALEHQSLLASIKRVSGLINSSLEASKQFILFHSSLTHASKGSPSSSHTSLMQANNKLVEALANCVHELCDEQPLTTEARSAVPQDGGGS